LLRWMILSVTFAVWAGTMVLVYTQFAPKADSDATPGTTTALRNIFSEKAEPRQFWHIYVDAEHLNDNPDSPMAKLMSSSSRALIEDEPPPTRRSERKTKQPWDGRDESGFVRVGWVETLLKKQNDTRAEQSSRLEMNFPPELKMPMMQLLGNIVWESRTEITVNRGLERFKSRITAGIGFEISALGIREEDALAVTLQVWEHGRQVLNQLQTMTVGQSAAPNVSLLPFQNNIDVKPGYKWDIPMLDPMGALSGEQKVKVVKATCTGKAQIQYQGERWMAFVVETEDGSARAWYSGGGQVLKQVFSFAGALDVILVRADPDREPLNFRPGKPQRRSMEPHPRAHD